MKDYIFFLKIISLGKYDATKQHVWSSPILQNSKDEHIQLYYFFFKNDS